MPGAIVIPIIGPAADPDRVSEQALPVARALAARTAGLVVLVSVMEFMEEFADLPESQIDDPEIIARRTDERRKYLEQIGETFGPSAVHTEVMQGDPAEAILSLVRTLDRPVVVMASQGKRGLKRMVLGSVAFDVVQRSTCPVLVVPVRDSDVDQTATATLARLLVPLDRSPQAEQAIDAALATLGSQPLTIRLVQIIPPLAQRSSRHASRHYATAREVAMNYLAGIEKRLTAHGHDTSRAVAIGPTEAELSREAREFGADLIVMATRGRTGFSRLLFGSVAEGIAQLGQCPILVINPSTIMPESLIPEPGAQGYLADGVPLVMRRARDIMVSPVITAREETTLEELAHTMLENRVGALPIVNDDGSLVGIVTESCFAGEEHCPPFSVYRMPQLLGEWVPRAGIERIYEAGRQMRARQIMSRPVVTATSDEPIASIVGKMVHHDITSVPIVDAGVLVGIVTRHDLLKMLARYAPGVTTRDDSDDGGV
jgi:nucleotide-binding universal stress UspA family protein/predicted transcriptional regulator